MGNRVVVNSELTHYGVLGMKWGIRKDRDVGGSHRPKDAEHQSPNRWSESADYQSEKKELKKDADDLRAELDDILKSERDEHRKIRYDPLKHHEILLRGLEFRERCDNKIDESTRRLKQLKDEGSDSRIIDAHVTYQIRLRGIREKLGDPRTWGYGSDKIFKFNSFRSSELISRPIPKDKSKRKELIEDMKAHARHLRFGFAYYSDEIIKAQGGKKELGALAKRKLVKDRKYEKYKELVKKRDEWKEELEALEKRMDQIDPLGNNVGLTAVLKHYGVLGMKWGIRKDRHLTSGGRIKAGTSVSRLTTNREETNEGSTYAIINSKLGSVPGPERDFIANYISPNPSSLYQIDMKTKVDLILPDMKEKGKIAVKKMLANPELREHIIRGSDEFLGDRATEERFMDRKRSINKAIKVKDIEIDTNNTGIASFKDPDVQKAYTLFAQALNDKKVRGAYIDILRRRGYNAVSDDLMDIDIKSTMISSRPFLAEKARNKGLGIGSAVGGTVGVGATALGLAGAIPAGTGLGAAIGSMAAYEKFCRNNPDDPMSIGTSSLIIFDRRDALDVVRTRPYKRRRGRR